MKENVHRINDGFEQVNKIGASDIYRKFKVQFNALFNPKDIAKSKEDFEEIYVHDDDFEKDIEDFRTSVGSMAAFCVGYTGIGKTTSLRHCFDLGIKNVTIYNEKRKELVFPSFFDGHNNLETDFSDALAKKIGSVCSYIERNNPDLKSYMKTMTGLSELVAFIEETKPEIIEVDPLKLVNMSERQEINYKLNYAYSNHKYSYNAIRLKFLISKKYDKYERLIIILDDVESLPEEEQKDLIRLYLSFFDCMANTEFPENTEYNINLLISLRPDTYRLFNNNSNIEAYPILGYPITKDKPADLACLFKNRFDYYTKKSSKVIGNIDSWNECYEHLEELNKLFQGKYKSMIINLCIMNIREALSCYARIFANRMWVQRNKEVYAEFTINLPDYTFNSITIIRALACNESKVYFSDVNNLLPCVFLNDRHRDYTVYCLLLLKLFYNRKPQNEYYGETSQEKKKIISELEEIFSSEIVQKFEECILHLFSIKLLKKSIRDKDDYEALDKKDSLKDNSLLYLSSKGEEMWKMFAQDSVLLEMFREAVYRDCDEVDFNLQCSFDLIDNGQQKEIFIDLIKYIENLSYKEDDLRNSVTEGAKREKYEEMFGSEMVVLHLLEGVKCSLKYSGIGEEEDIKPYLSKLQEQLNV